MMYSEFCEIAGYEVKYEDYAKYIEPMYMAVPDSVSKREFIAMVNRERFEVKPLAKLAREIKKSLKNGVIPDATIREYATRKWGADCETGVYIYFREVRFYQWGREVETIKG